MLRNLKPQASVWKAVDYEHYTLNGKEKILYSAEGILAVGVISYFFYRSLWACVFLAPIFFLVLKAVPAGPPGRLPPRWRPGCRCRPRQSPRWPPYRSR